jgi:hypothetical protein
LAAHQGYIAATQLLVEAGKITDKFIIPKKTNAFESQVNLTH